MAMKGAPGMVGGGEFCKSAGPSRAMNRPLVKLKPSGAKKGRCGGNLERFSRGEFPGRERFQLPRGGLAAFQTIAKKKLSIRSFSGRVVKSANHQGDRRG